MFMHMSGHSPASAGSRRPALVQAAAAVLLLLAAICAVAAVDFVPNEPAAIPSVVIIGAAKGGTSDVYGQLALMQHSDAAGMAAAEHFVEPVGKEGGLLIADGTHQMHNRHVRTYMEYLRHPCAAAPVLSECMYHNASARGMLTIDATTSYMFRPLAPLTLRSLSPTSKVVAMLRDPVDMVHSL